MILYYIIYVTHRRSGAALGLKPIYSRPDDLRELLVSVELVPRIRADLLVSRPVPVGLESVLGFAHRIDEGLGLPLLLAGLTEMLDRLGGVVGDGVQAADHLLPLLVFPTLVELGEGGLGDFGGNGGRISGEETVDSGLGFGLHDILWVVSVLFVYHLGVSLATDPQ